MKYADKVKTPTLFLHSLEDYRCPVDQGYQMYSALIAHGVESRLCSSAARTTSSPAAASPSTASAA